MTRIFFIVLLFFSNATFGQVLNLAGIFISADQDRLALNRQPGGIPFENKNMYHLYFDKAVENKNILKMYLNKNAVIKDKSYTFATENVTKDSFTLIPLSKSVTTIFEGRTKVTFYRQGLFVDSSLKFEKLIFYQGQSENYYSNGIALEIDSNQKLRLRFNDAFDPTQSGNFIGHLTQLGFEKLINILRRVNLTKLNWPKSEFYGQSPQKLIVYFNGQKKELKSIGDAPYISMDLILFLMNIKKFSNLEKTNSTIKFDD